MPRSSCASAASDASTEARRLWRRRGGSARRLRVQGRSVPRVPWGPRRPAAAAVPLGESPSSSRCRSCSSFHAPTDARSQGRSGMLRTITPRSASGVALGLGVGAGRRTRASCHRAARPRGRALRAARRGVRRACARARARPASRRRRARDGRRARRRASRRSGRACRSAVRRGARAHRGRRRDPRGSCTRGAATLRRSRSRALT